MVPWPQRKWLSAHLALAEGVVPQDTDAVLLKVVAPFVRACRGRPWFGGCFFVRYSERGPHLRVRVRIRPGKERLARALLGRHVRAHQRAEQAARNLDGRGEGGHTAIKKLTWVDYRPEVERYGGVEGLAVAEHFFCQSSAACLRVLKVTAGQDRAALLGRALLVMLHVIAAFSTGRAHAVDFLERYAAGHLRRPIAGARARAAWARGFKDALGRQFALISPAVWRAWRRARRCRPALACLGPFPRMVASSARRLFRLDRAGRLSSGLGSQGRVMERIVASYVHMTNNRLGLSLVEEAYLAYLIAGVLAGTGIAPETSRHE